MLCPAQSFTTLFFKSPLEDRDHFLTLYLQSTMTKLYHVINCGNDKLALMTILFPIQIFSYLTLAIKNYIPVSNLTSTGTESYIKLFLKMFIRYFT